MSEKTTIDYLKEAHHNLLLAYASISPTKFEAEIINNAMRKCGDALSRLTPYASQPPVVIEKAAEKSTSDKAFLCPKCGCDALMVLSAKVGKNKNIRCRNRICVKCNHEFKTYESVDKPLSLKQGPAPKIDKATFMHVVNLSRSLQDVADKYGVTRERIRQVAVSLGIAKEVKLIFKQNRQQLKSQSPF